MEQKTVVDFDIDRYMRNSKKVDLSHLDWDDIPNHHLSDGDVMCMHYMMDIESHTVIYLRDLLATRAAADPYITAFLSCWVYEELWHGEAFSDFLRAYGIEEPIEPRLPDGSSPMASSASSSSATPSSSPPTESELTAVALARTAARTAIVPRFSTAGAAAASAKRQPILMMFAGTPLLRTTRSSSATCNPEFSVAAIAAPSDAIG